MVSLTHPTTTSPSRRRERRSHLPGALSISSVVGIAGLHRFMVAALAWAVTP